MDKGKRKPKRHLEFTMSTDNKSIKNIFYAKPCDIQQPIRYFKLFATWYINIPQTDFWEKVNSVQQLQNKYMWWRKTCKSFDIRDRHGKFSKKFEFRFTSFESCTVIL